VGPSGAGKTTLLRLLNGTATASTGTVLVDGQDLSVLHVRALRRVRSRVGFVHQDHSLVPNLRVSQNVVAGKLGERGLFGAARSMLFPKREDIERVYALLDRVGIPDKLYERTDTLSGGEQQRVALARALFQDPSALLADEPFASVDRARALDLVDLITGVATERSLTLVVSLHDRGLARMFPRIVGLRAGQVVFDSTAETVLEEELEELFRLESASHPGTGASMIGRAVM
jgi:phosphonate transport system ATP-binding protein